MGWTWLSTAASRPSEIAPTPRPGEPDGAMPTASVIVFARPGPDRSLRLSVCEALTVSRPPYGEVSVKALPVGTAGAWPAAPLSKGAGVTRCHCRGNC
jgi:hypothetical protein